MTDLVITGASSFLGRALLSQPLPAGFSGFRALVHDQPVTASGRVTPVTGDLRDPQSLRRLITPGATVIHLAYLATASPLEDNLSAAHNLLAACGAASIRRLVHCSTAVVAGNVEDDVVTEETACRPHTGYERAKYRIEEAMREAQHEVAILRPTVVFGPGGRNLLSQVRRIARGSVVANLAYGALQGTRRMNLVSVHNVVAALRFLAETARAVDRQAYIVSDDGDPSNNYRDVARIIGRELGRPGVVSRSAWPASLLKATLRWRGRSNVNPQRIYADDKLKAAGFAKPWAFEPALVEFARWAAAQPGVGGTPR